MWIEVSKTIYTDSKYNTNKEEISENDWEKIRDCLKTYTSDYSNSLHKDTNEDGTTYSDDYIAMLKSIYKNGGFWIGRYEAGLEENTPRTEYRNITSSDKAVIKQNKIPYNYVKRDEAQILAQRMNYNNCTTSLLYGIQWDLVLKYIETTNATTQENLISNSTAIGNYRNSDFTLNRGKFAQYTSLSNWYNFNSEEKVNLVSNSKKFPQSLYENAILLTTGATDVTILQNIYDIAGNVCEWTLERSFFNTKYPCVVRGGGYNYDGSEGMANARGNDNTINSYSDVGFRIGLWK